MAVRDDEAVSALADVADATVWAAAYAGAGAVPYPTLHADKALAEWRARGPVVLRDAVPVVRRRGTVSTRDLETARQPDGLLRTVCLVPDQRACIARPDGAGTASKWSATWTAGCATCGER